MNTAALAPSDANAPRGRPALLGVTLSFQGNFDDHKLSSAVSVQGF
jgi:hypothetical protein